MCLCVFLPDMLFIIQGMRRSAQFPHLTGKQKCITDLKLNQRVACHRSYCISYSNWALFSHLSGSAVELQTWRCLILSMMTWISDSTHLKEWDIIPSKSSSVRSVNQFAVPWSTFWTLGLLWSFQVNCCETFWVRQDSGTSGSFWIQHCEAQYIRTFGYFWAQHVEAFSSGLEQLTEHAVFGGTEYTYCVLQNFVGASSLHCQFVSDADGR